MTYAHQIVTQIDREITTAEFIICKSNKPKFSMNCYLKLMKGVQYEIVNLDTNEVTIIGLSK